MDSNSIKKTNLQATLPQTIPKQLHTPDSSPPKPLTFRNTPSPDRAYTAFKHPQSSLQKAFPEHPSSTEQYTPLGISRSRLLSARTPDDIDQLVVEHRYEVETLLLQIGRLKEELNQSHELREQEVRKARAEFQDESYLQISQIRQNQQGQAEIFQQQIRKLKEQLSDKSQQADKLQTLLSRQKDTNQRERNRFQDEVRLLIEKKNAEIYELKQDSDNKLKDFQFQRINQIEQVKYTCDKELDALNKALQKHEKQFNKLKKSSENQNKEKQKIILYLESQRDSVERRYEQRLAEQTVKYENIRNKFNEMINQFSQDSQTSRAELQKLFQTEYEHMINLVKTFHKDNNDLRKQLQTSIISGNIERQTYKEESDALKQKINELTENGHVQIELLKVKLAALHQNDLKNLKELYELKLKNSSDSVARLDEEVSKLRQFVNVLSSEKYEMRKRYDNTISGLNSKIIKMKMGFNSMEKEYKEKLDNQKSVMLMTSRSFMKQAEARDNNNKFLEEQVRKLRQLMDLQGRENENAQRAIEEKVLAANNELDRLSSKVLVIAKEKKDLEKALDDLRSEKDAEIQRLRKQFTPPDPIKEEGGVIPEIKVIEDLREELSKKKEEIGVLKDRVETLESRLKEMQAETQRLQMENNINTEELKQQFQGVSEKHLTDFKRYYEEKLQRMADEKTELKKIISSKSEQITELIKKYNQIEEDVREATKMMKKRTELQQKVMNIGLDVNIVKNMTQLLPGHNN